MHGKIGLPCHQPSDNSRSKRAIAEAISDNRVKVRGPGNPPVNLLAQQPFWFNALRTSPPKDASGDCGCDYPPSPHWPSRGWECNRRWRDQRPGSPQFPSPSLHCGFESNRSLLSATSLMLSRSDWSDGSRLSRQGRQHREEACKKINLPVFKDMDTKDAVTYQSYRWDLTMYQCAGCRDCILLLYAIRSLQGYPGKLVRSSGTDITLDDMLTILEEHYNNVRVLDVLNQELFQL